MSRSFVLLYGLVAYVLFLGAFLYAIGFVGGLVVPKTIDSGTAGSGSLALLVNMGLLSLFALQHSVMARPAFKQWWTQIIPPAIERSTFVLASSVALIVLYLFWRPMPSVVWEFTATWVRAGLWAAFAIGWLMVLASTFVIDHFDLFGLRQVLLHYQGKPYTAIPFQVRSMYRYVRHPIMLGFLIAFWATPTMTQGHLLFAVVVTVYVLVALQLEERDLMAYHGESYLAYRRRVPMLVPIRRMSAEKIPPND